MHYRTIHSNEQPIPLPATLYKTISSNHHYCQIQYYDIKYQQLQDHQCLQGHTHTPKDTTYCKYPHIYLFYCHIQMLSTYYTRKTDEHTKKEERSNYRVKHKDISLQTLCIRTIYIRTIHELLYRTVHFNLSFFTIKTLEFSCKVIISRPPLPHSL